jgi:hypothetical protein
MYEAKRVMLHEWCPRLVRDESISWPFIVVVLWLMFDAFHRGCVVVVV